MVSTRGAECANASLLTTSNAASPDSGIRMFAGRHVGTRRRATVGPTLLLTPWTTRAVVPKARTTPPWFTVTGQSTHQSTGVHPRSNDPFNASLRDRYGDEGTARRMPTRSKHAPAPATTPVLTPAQAAPKVTTAAGQRRTGFRPAARAGGDS